MDQKNSVILHSYFRSSASYRVRIALALKDISFEYKAIHLLKDGGQQRQQSYTQLNPMKHVPTLEHDGLCLSESMAIIKYLDHLKETPRLFPKEAKKEAQVIQACEYINSGIQPLQNLKVLQHLETLGVDKDGQKEWIKHWVTPGLKALDLLLEKTAGTHCFGDDWSAADCFLIPQIFSSLRFGVEYKDFNTIAKIYSNLENHPMIQKAHPSNQPDSE